MIPQQVLVQVEYLSKRKHVDQELVDSVTCPLCLCIVVTPQECSNCEKLYCDIHVKEWTRTKKTCPTCRSRPWKLKPHCHRVYLQLLETLEFSCPCGEYMPYKQFLAHPFGKHHEEQKNRLLLEAEAKEKEQQEAKQRELREAKEAQEKETREKQAKEQQKRVDQLKERQAMERQKRDEQLRAREEKQRQQKWKQWKQERDRQERERQRQFQERLAEMKPINIVSINRGDIQPANEQKVVEPDAEHALPPILPSPGGPMKQSLIRSKLQELFNDHEQEKHEQPAIHADPNREDQFMPLDKTKKYYFYFIPKKGATVFLNRQSNAQINRNIRKGIVSFDLQIDSKHVLYFEIALMRVTDSVRKVVFDLFFEEIKGAVWRYVLNHNEFVYPPDIMEKVEEAYQKHLKREGPVTVDIQFENTLCQINVETMDHINLTTKATRKVKRRQT